MTVTITANVQEKLIAVRAGDI